MSFLFILLLQLSKFVESGAGWTLHKGVKTVSSVSARVTSNDARSFLIVRCDNKTAPVVSIQYVPIEDVGLSLAPISLILVNEEGKRVSFDVVWEAFGGGAVARDDYDSKLVSGFVLQMGNNPGHLEVMASDLYGKPIVQSYENERGREHLDTVVKTCLSYEQGSDS